MLTTKTDRVAKQKIVYYCTDCGYKAVQWSGKCPSCGNWNTFQEEIEIKSNKTGAVKPSPKFIQQQLHTLGTSPLEKEVRIKTSDQELNRVLGGGVVQGSLVLVGGKPGIGKSTLMLQLALSMQKEKVLYFSGEESLNQVNLRASRLQGSNPNLLFVSETDFDTLEAAIEEASPSIVIVDSIQTLQRQEIESSPGSVVQIRECTNRLLQIAKTKGCSIFIIGHITKDGNIAGPKVLEHMVDVVLYFDDTSLSYRFIKATKNRFGTTSEVGIYEMTNGGLQPVENPSNIFVDHFGKNLSGVAISSTMEGARPILTEIQVLINNSSYGTPQRTSNGFDSRRLAMLLAVLEKHCGLKLAQKDVFLNVTGGLKLNDPAVDLAVIAALASSYFEHELPSQSLFCGEVGLTGEIRPVRLMSERVNESSRLGIKKVFVSAKTQFQIQPRFDLMLVTSVQQLMGKIFK